MEARYAFRKSQLLEECQVAPEIFHIPSDLVVDRWASEMKSSSSLDFLFLCSVWTTFYRLMGDKITSAISMA